MRGRHIRAVVVLAVVAAFAVTAGCDLATNIRLPVGTVYPSITPDAAATGALTVTHAFRFEGGDRTVSIVIEDAVYRGAKSATKSVVRFGDARADDWIEDYYPAFIWEERQEEFFSALIASLRTIREAEGLDSDRYAELLTVFVQSLEYRTDPVDLEPKFPIETFTERAGDCDDKALLLAGLLAREGYDVAIMLFQAEEHVALGLKTTGNDYRGTGYAYVETTSPGFIGMVPDELAGGITVESHPRVFSIDGGSRAYGAGAEVATILEMRDTADERITSLGRDLANADADLAASEPGVTRESDRLDSLRRSGRIDEYNATLPAFNEMIARFNASVATRNSLAEEHNRWVELQRFIAENLDDRPAVYRHVITANRR